MNSETKALKKLVDLLRSTTIHGIPNLVKTKILAVKLIWSIFMIISFGLCIFFLIDAILIFYDHEYVTNIIEIDQLKAPFPTITLCINSPKQNLSDILIYCVIDLRVCSWTEFEILNETTETCFRFNSKEPIFHAKRTDIKSAFNICILTSADYFGFFKAVLYVQNHTNIFRRNRVYNFESGEYLPPGINEIKISREFVEKLPLPFNDCLDIDKFELNQSNIYDYFINNNKEYTQKDCFDLCIENELLSECNCSSKLGEYLNCYSNEILKDCLDLFLHNYRSKQKDLNTKCLNECKVECKRFNYNILKNYVGLQTLKSYRYQTFYLEKMPNYERLNDSFLNENLQNFIFVTISYSTLNYKYINQLPKTRIVDLVSNLGGTLGLFIGVSFLSFVELFEIAIELLVFMFKSNRNKSKVFNFNYKE